MSSSKKIYHKYEFLILELKETQDKLQEYLNIFNRTFQRYLPPPKLNTPKPPPPPIPPSPFYNPEDHPLNKSKKKPRKKHPKEYKSLYKKLSSKLHPDKGGTNEDFLNLNKAYEEDDIVELTKLAFENEVEVEEGLFTKDLIEDKLNTIETELETIRTSLAWKFGEGDYTQKENVRRYLERHYKIKIPKESLKEFE